MRQLSQYESQLCNEPIGISQSISPSMVSGCAWYFNSQLRYVMSFWEGLSRIWPSFGTVCFCACPGFWQRGSGCNHFLPKPS